LYVFQVKAIEIRGRDAHCRFESADQMRLALKMGRDFQNSELNLAPASKAVLQVKQLFTDQVQAPGTAPPSQPASVVVRPATATVQPQPVVPIKLRLVRPNKSQSTPPPLLPVAESEPEPEEDEPEQDEDEPEDAEDNEEEFDDDQDDQDEQDDQDDQNDQEQDYSDEDQSHDSDQDDGDEQQEEAEPIQVLPAMLAAPQSNQKVQDARQKAMEAKKKREEAARLESQPPRVSPSPQPVNDDEEGDHLRDGFVGIGQCMHLTTEIDFKQRTESRNTSVFEHYDCQSWKERDFERSLMLKPNIRSGAGSIALPENIRPPVVLQRAMHHIIDFCMIHEGAAYHPDLFNDFDEQAGLVRLWTFLFDRCRSIRKDFIYQVSASRGCLSVAVHEQQTRFFVYCAHSLYSTLQHDSTQALGFSWKLNDESINRSISSLLIYYSDNRARGRVFESGSLIYQCVFLFPAQLTELFSCFQSLNFLRTRC
jgi:chemotaxis protein histidine kinase CheA